MAEQTKTPFDALLDALQGRKTYVVAALTLAAGVAQAMGWLKLPNEAWPILGALGLGFLRAGVKK